MPLSQHGETNIYYEEHGQGESFMLTYGLAGNTSLWEPQVEAFSRDHRLVLWDQRGHGSSDSPADPEEYGVWNSVEDLRSLMAHLAIGQAVIGGQSMGGGVAMRFALKYPRQTKALVIVNSHSASGLNAAPHVRAMRSRSIDIVQTESMTAMAEFSMTADPNTASHLRCSSDGEQAARERVRRMFSALDPVGYVNAVLAARKSDDISRRLGEIKAPTLLVTGDQDPALSSMEFINKQIPHATLEIIDNAGHHANIDRSREFNDAVLRFLGSIST